MPLVDVDGATKPIVHVLIEEALAGMGWSHEEETKKEKEKEADVAAATADAAASPAAGVASSPSASSVSICLVVRSLAHQLAIENYFAAVDPADHGWTEDPTLQPMNGRLAAIGQLLHFIVQDEPLGLGHAVLLAREWVGAEPFLLLCSDRAHLTAHPAGRVCTRQLLDAYAHLGANGSGAMVLGVGPMAEEEDELEEQTLIHGTHLTGIDIYATHTELQRKIAEQHKKHGLDLAAMALQNEGVSRFTKTPVAPPPPPEATQGELYRVTKLVEHPTEEQAKKEFRVEKPKSSSSSSTAAAYGYPDLASAARHLAMGTTPNSTGSMATEYLGCVGLDVLGPAIFEVLERMQAEIDAEQQAKSANGEAQQQATDPVEASTQITAPPRRRLLSLRSALSSLLTSASPAAASPTPTALFSIRLLATHFSLNYPGEYARCMQAFLDEAAERSQVREDAQLLATAHSGPPRKQEIIGPTQKDLPQRSGPTTTTPAATAASAAGASSQSPPGGTTVPSGASSSSPAPVTSGYPGLGSPPAPLSQASPVVGYPGMKMPTPVVVGYPGMQSKAASQQPPPAASPITASNAASRRVAYD